MDIGVGLPSTIPGATRSQILEWARRADASGLSSLGTLDRTVYGNVEPLVTLAAAAAVTERIHLMTSILIAPLHANTALLAKQALSVDALAGGRRLVLGLAVGGRQDDYEAGGVDFAMRGRRFEAQLAELRRIWDGESRGTAGAIGPVAAQPGGPRLLLGGTADGAIARVVRHGEGWISGGGGPDAFAGGAGRVRAAWHQAGREGTPRLASLAYYALGPAAEDHASSYLRDYYAFAGPYTEMVVEGAAVGQERLAEQVDAFEAAGCDELVLFPCAPGIDQLELLVEAVGDRLPG